MLYTVMHRSKGKTLPAFSQDDSPVGDVFFDVSTSAHT